KRILFRRADERYRVFRRGGLPANPAARTETQGRDVTQRAFLFPGSVAENISFGPRQRGQELPADEIDRLLVQAGLPGFGHRNVANLSGGEARRVSLASMTQYDPDPSWHVAEQ